MLREIDDFEESTISRNRWCRGLNFFEHYLKPNFRAVANSKLWCSADYDFNENKRFIPCADGAFYQGCGMLSKSAHDGQWVTDYGSKVSPRPDPNQDEARGCYSAEYFVCEMMKDGTDGRPMPTEEPPLGPDCLGTGWSGYTTDGGQPSNKCYKVYSWHNEPTANNSIGVDFGEALEWCRAHNADMISLHSREQEQKVNDLIVKYEDSKLKYRDWYWLGFNDRGEKGYQWTDGTGDDYTNWAAGQPEKTLNLEDCSITVMRYDSDPIDEGSDFHHKLWSIVLVRIRMVHGNIPGVPFSRSRIIDNFF